MAVAYVPAPAKPPRYPCAVCRELAPAVFMAFRYEDVITWKDFERTMYTGRRQLRCDPLCSARCGGKYRQRQPLASFERRS